MTGLGAISATEPGVPAGGPIIRFPFAPSARQGLGGRGKSAMILLECLGSVREPAR